VAAVGRRGGDPRGRAAHPPAQNSTTAAPGSATALVTHTGNIGGAFDQSVSEGDILVVRGDEQLGIVKPEDWQRLAEAAESD
jgi:hypothetical protein